MTDYSSLGLNERMQALSSVAGKSQTIRAVDFDYQTERGAVGNIHLRDASISNAKMGTAVIGTANIGTLSFNEVTGGTANLGGTNNGNGVLSIKMANGSEFFRGDGGTVKSVFTVGGTVFVIDAATETLWMGGFICGGTGLGSSNEGFIYFRAGTSTFALFTIDEFAIGRKVRLGGTDVFGGYPTSLELWGTATTNVVGTPGANACRIYMDVSGGKNRIMAQFDSGTPVLVAAEP